MRFKKMVKFLVIPFMLLGLCAIHTSTAHAETGDFYDKYKTKLEKESLVPDDLDLMKKYDEKNNSFDCGALDFQCKMDGTIYKMIIGAVKLSYGGIDSFVISPSKITDNPVFLSYKNGLKSVSWTMLSIFLMWQIMKLVAQRYASPEDGMVALNDKLLMVFVSGILLGIYNQLFSYILNIEQTIVSAVLNDPVSLDDIIFIIFRNSAFYGFLIAFVIMLVMLIFSIAYMYRFVLFGLLFVVGVIAIPTSLNDEYNYFSVWLRTIISNVVTLFIQAICFSLGFQALVKENAFSMGASFTVGIAFFILAMTVPSILGQLGASSGSSRSIGTLIRYATRKIG